MAEPTIELPAWVIAEGRSLSYPARWVLVELFVQGERVKTGKASGEMEFVVWNQSLEQLRGCSSSSITRAKNELIGRGLLLEWPGQRWVNGVPRSAWAVPLVLAVLEHVAISRHPSISIDAPEHASITRGASVEYEPAGGHKKGAEHVAKSRDARPSRARGLDHQQQTPSAPTTNTTNHLPDTETPPVPGEGAGAAAAGGFSPLVSLTDLSQPLNENHPLWASRSGGQPLGETAVEARRVALEGLRWAKYSKPEGAVKDFGADRCLAALEQLCLAVDRGDRIAKPGGYVNTWLVNHKGRDFAPAGDLSFARHWDASYAESVPANVRRFGR